MNSQPHDQQPTSSKKRPRHDKTHFYKYVTAETALAILRSGCFRFTSPLRFDDPFDMQTELLFDFDKASFPELLSAEIERLVLGQKRVSLDQQNKWAQAVTLLKSEVKQHGHDGKYVEATIQPFVRLVAHTTDKLKSDLNADLRSAVARARVFCVSEIPDSILMWVQYADCHRGVVFKLARLPARDNALCVAAPVTYKRNPWTFVTVQQLVDHIIGAKRIDSKKLSGTYPYVKSRIWRYQHEWRVWIPDVEDGDGRSDYRFCPEEIEAIYFGCRATNTQMDSIVRLARQLHPRVSFFKARKSAEKYCLIFDTM